MSDIKKFEPFWGNWYIKKELGEGSFGKVYSIERRDFGNIYTAALKHIRIPVSQSEVKSVIADGIDAEKYFENLVSEIVEEFVLMSKLKGNSHIVSYEDHNVIKNPNKIEWDIFIRMEKLTAMIDYIAKNKIGKKDIIRLGIDICKALELCQKYNIVHRDIKPENIFISESGNYKLGDFGIARQLEKTTAGLSKKGTFTYIAPEIYKGEAYGSTVDIYSLGIVMYRLLNDNRTPFLPHYPNPITHSDREIALVKRISGTPLPNPVNAEGRLAEIVLKACEYEPKNRYNSPLLMRMELESILYNESEGKIIYPKGDTADIKSLYYVKTDSEETETMTVSSEQTELMTDKVNIPINTIEQKKNKKVLFYTLIVFITSLLLWLAGYAYLKNLEIKNMERIQAEEEARKEEERKAEEARKIEEEKKAAEEAAKKAEEEKRAAEEAAKKAEEEARKEEERKAEEARKAEEVRQAEEARKAQQQKSVQQSKPVQQQQKPVQQQKTIQQVQQQPVQQQSAPAPTEAPAIMVDFD